MALFVTFTYQSSHSCAILFCKDSAPSGRDINKPIYMHMNVYIMYCIEYMYYYYYHYHYCLLNNVLLYILCLLYYYLLMYSYKYILCLLTFFFFFKYINWRGVLSCQIFIPSYFELCNIHRLPSVSKSSLIKINQDRELFYRKEMMTVTGVWIYSLTCNSIFFSVFSLVLQCSFNWEDLDNTWESD